MIEFQGEIGPLGFRLMKQHILAWNLNETIINAPEPTNWFLPYDKEEIMRYGNTVNRTIPPDPEEAEFPDEPWPTDVIIRIKSHPPPQLSPDPIPNSGPPQSFHPPGSWLGPAPGQAPPISQNASALVDYNSPNSVQTVDGQPEEPPDEGLQAFRGLADRDELVHRMLSWTTLESYPLRIGISLPIPNQAMVDGEEVFHEAQLWEETEEEFIIEENHAEAI
jgi:hypothetical protein